jgi:hypothetical protein
MTLHGIGDPIAFVEHESAYRETVERAGNAARLVQVFTAQNEHRSLGSPEYLAALSALMAWIDGGHRPSTKDIAAGCRALLPKFDGEPCRIQADFNPAAWDTRAYPRAR